MTDDKSVMKHIDPRQFGVYVLSPDAFDESVEILLSPSEPTASIKRGAELLRKLYGHKRC